MNFIIVYSEEKTQVAININEIEHVIGPSGTSQGTIILKSGRRIALAPGQQVISKLEKLDVVNV